MYYGEKEYYIQNYIRVGRNQDVINIKYIYIWCALTILNILT